MGFGISRNPGFCQRLAERGVIRDPLLGNYEYINGVVFVICHKYVPRNQLKKSVDSRF